MIRIIFKNLERSELTRSAAQERIESVIEKFPDLRESRIDVTLEMENSPFQSGRDVFNVKLQVFDGKYRGVRLRKSATNLYVALADVVEHLLEKLSRAGHRSRSRRLRRARQQLLQPVLEKPQLSEADLETDEPWLEPRGA